MKTIYSPDHLAHMPAREFEAGRLTPAVEVPERAERVRARIADRRLGPILPPEPFGLEPVLRVHDAGLIRFLTDAYDDWQKIYPGHDAIPSAWPARGLRERREGGVAARLGTYVFDTGTPVTKGSWQAARAAADTALTAATALQKGDESVFALARPPGHHAAADLFGGYCYLNNVAIAAQWLTERGARVAVVDVDYHHGNGTQAIFYDRADVLFVSLHADPAFAYPYFLGSADETGRGAGEGFNLNLPLPAGTDWTDYAQALQVGLARVADFAPDVVLVSLGLDTFEGDPICRFALRTPDYLCLGAALRALGRPTGFFFEGGYNLEHLAENTVNVLEGFLS